MKRLSPILVSILGCATVTENRAPTLPLPAVLGADFVVEQKVQIRHGEQSGSFRAVLQKHQGVLRLVGLTPFGTRAFLIEQVGHSTRLENYTGRALPFGSDHILADIYRILSPPTRTIEQGELTGATALGPSEDRFDRSLLVERVFVSDQIRIGYGKGWDGTSMPGTASYENLHRSYSIEIRSQGYRRLADDSRPRP